MSYDIIVIGCGSGGYEAALLCSRLGGKVAVVEAEDIGGTCVNRGCIPSKVWHRAATMWQAIDGCESFGIRVSGKKLDYKTVVGRKNKVSQDIRTGMEAMLSGNGIELIRGRGILKSPREIEVGEKTYQTKKVIIASGSSLDIPEIAGLRETAMTTDDVLNMDRIPASVLIYGDGYIEVEKAHLLNALGAKVILATPAARILEKEDHETSQRITQVLRDRQVQVVPRVMLQSIRNTGGKVECIFSGPKEQTMEAGKILIAARKPNVTGMGLNALGIKLNNDGGIEVNDRLETSVDGVYAIGDATGGWMLSHAASSMASTAAMNAMGRTNLFPFHLVPRGVWTTPEMGAVGLSEEEAEKKGYDVEVASFPFAINGLAMCRDEQEGAVKIVADAKYGEILGVHIVGSQATELVGEAVLAMQLQSTVGEFARSIRVHPTFSEALVQAMRGVDI